MHNTMHGVFEAFLECMVLTYDCGNTEVRMEGNDNL